MGRPAPGTLRELTAELRREWCNGWIRARGGIGDRDGGDE